MVPPSSASKTALGWLVRASVAVVLVALAVAVLWWTELWCEDEATVPAGIPAKTGKERAAGAEALQVLVVFTLAGAAGKIGSFVDGLFSLS
eukprot:CAMPEP_0170412988 /NCGR_PEP_ID=MMETSP0117_2-20130122/31276_1 /TAXON_ID=400756 /ORGANISM="Durinskia baltica, Strain CSIRO CS-38" /LENGTH=90 /DNA_ID=CAMNT_0010670743 /DNA_START=109 /DNA_END=381 /DNA_ORIENTATION=+